MAIERISKSDFATLIESGVNSRDPEIDTSIGPIRDLRIDPFAEVLEFQNNRVVYLSQLNSLINAKNLVPDDLDKIVYNETIVRWGGSVSVTVVYFSRSQAPTVDIPVPINFPLATVEDPKTGRSVQFRTIETQTMFSAMATTYYNADTAKYELPVTVASVLTGVDTKVGAFTIKVMRRTLPGFDSVHNKLATSSGRVIETNQELADRYLLHIKGAQLGTPTGNEAYTLDNFSAVEDVYSVYGNNTYLTREEEDAGACDVWILGSTPLTRIYDVAYPGVEVLIPLDRQPLIEIISVVSGATTFIEGTDYEVVSDTGAYSRSSSGQDGIRFISGGSVPANIRDSVSVTYQYNALIDILTSFFTQSKYYAIGMDKLYRWAYAIDIEISGELKVGSGNPDYIRTTVISIISTYINDLKLGADVEEFDLDREIAKVAGVDNFTWVQLSIKGGNGVGDITVAPYQYPEIADADLVVSLV